MNIGRKEWTYLVSVLAGLLFILLAIIVITVNSGLRFNLLQVHGTNPEIYLL